MIREDTKQAWVTLALTDKEALQSLVLAKSLERTLTTRKICIFISQGVSREMKYLLLQVFDIVVTISNEELQSVCAGENEPNSYAIFWFWTLKEFRKCVFLSPGFLVKTNCDELFKQEETSAFIHLRNETKFDPSIFVFRPNFKTYEQLLDLAKSGCSGNGTEVINLFFKNWTKLSEKHRRFFSTNAFNTGVFNDEWLQVYFHHVLPFLNSQTDTSVRVLISALTTENGFTLPKPIVNSEIIQHEESLEDYRGTVAVVGMSCRLPGANNAAEYWKLLSEGREAIRRFPTDRPFLGKPQAREMQAGFLNCAVDEFDAKFFGISPREALLVDPQQRLLLEVTWESLEHAGINPQTLRDTDTGVYVGMWQQDYERIILESKRDEENDETTGFLHIFLGNKYSATASRISFCLGLNGPAIAVESGCSSSLNGLHLACEGLRSGETSLALVSGVNLILLPFNPFSGKDAGEESVVLSKDYRCKTFDESADGFVRAEACGVVVLKRFEDAWRDGDNILAIVKGSAVNNDGQGTSFGTPNEKAQEKVYRSALKNANIRAADVSYIETHGTGTAVGDPIEMYAVGQAYSENRVEPLLVGSVKTNIGHCEAAAGIASLIKVILCIENSAIPPHLNLKTLNPRIDLSRIPAKIPMELTPWTAPKKIAAISSFSMSATNAHVILQEPPRQRITKDDSDNLDQLITMSAKSEQALTDICKSYVHFLRDKPEQHRIKDIAYSANTGRAHLQHRLTVVASDPAQLLSRLEKGNYVQGKAPTLKSKIGFLFTGQGSQYFGMAQGLADAFPIFKNALDACDVFFKTSLNETLSNVLFNNETFLNQTLYCQPALFCVQYCLLQLWNFYGIQPDCVLGHSVGEFAAAVCAGILTLEDAMKLVITRSKLVNELPTGSMTAIRATESEVAELIKMWTSTDKEKWIDVAAVNSQEEVVVSGVPDSIKRFEIFCLNNGVQSVTIPATHAFHSRAMEPVLPEFGRLADTTSVGAKMKCTYISGTLAKAVEPMEFGSHYWQRHLRDSVKFSDAIKLVWTECKTLVEIGPQPILLGLTMANVEDSTNSGTYVPTLRKKDVACTSFHAALSKLYIAGFDFDWSNVYGMRKKRVNLPFYPFQRQRYWYMDEVSREDELSPLLHPLLGRQFLSPVTDLVFCQTYRLKDLKYIEDHKVANFVIVPVAALLESFMAASREVLQGGSQNRFPITIENLMVEAALPLEKNCRIQTLVASEQAATVDTLSYKLSLNRKMESHFDKWKRHATAVFTPSSTLPDTPMLDLKSLQTKLNHRESLESSYKAIADVGIQFGPKFQSVCSAWYGPGELLTQINLPEEHSEYICHPIVLDAIIQTSALREYLTQSADSPGAKKALYLPISIKKFTWLSRVSTPTVYAHSIGQNGNVTLYNSTGEPLGIMEGLELLQTSIASVVRAIRADAVEVPDFMCDRWRSVLGKSTGRIDISKLTVATEFSPNVAENKDVVQGFTSEQITEALEAFATGIFYSFVIGIQESGWPWPAVNDIITPATWKPHLPETLNEGIIMIYLNDMETRGYVREVNYDDQTFQVLKPLESIKQCEQIIEDLRDQDHKYSAALKHESIFGERLKKCFPLILQGKMKPLDYLFLSLSPADESEPGAEYFYTKSMICGHQNTLIQSFFKDTLAQYQDTTHNSKDGILRILEVGAGTGSSSVQLIQILRDHKIPFQYAFTDISPLFLNEAKKLNLGPEVTYQIFNMEEDPLTQGFAPQEFDLILGVQCVHATANINESLTNLKRVLKVGGILILGEGFRAYTGHMFVFGITEGWWRFNDFRVGSKLTALASEEQWKECLSKAGFDSINSVPGLLLGALAARNALHDLPRAVPEVNRRKWLVVDDESSVASAIITNLQNYDRKVEALTPETVNTGYDLQTSVENETVEGIMVVSTEFGDKGIVETQQNITSSLLNILKSYDKHADKFKIRPKFMLVTRGVYNIGDAEPGNPNGATAWAMMKVFRNEHPTTTINLIDLDQAGSEFENDQILNQIWSNDGEFFVAYRQNKKYVMRLTYIDKPPLPIQLPATDRFRFINPESGAFTDIEVGPRGKSEILEDNIELEVRACALNFRNIFMVLKPEGFTLPDDNTLGTLDSVGLDVSGVVSAVGPNVTRFQVGDEVFGMTNDGALGSHTVAKEKAFMKIPPSMTFVEACTIPCAFITAHISLVQIAKLTSADRVLIHVATGGVGIASIQVARNVGAEIYATAGNKRKRAYLRAMGIKYVYHSRDTSYGEGIERDTKGQGITVVLNSLTGPNFKETTLKVCSEGARFVEIAKINIWKVEEVAVLRPDVKYTILDLSKKDAIEDAQKESSDSKDITTKLENYVNEKIYTGLPSIVFQLSQVREAFYYFQKALHIGKVVVQIPKYAPNPSGKFEHKINIFNDKSTYMITGGLGGLGLEVTKWMRTMGAQTIVLVGRSPPPESVQRLIDSWNRDGSRIIVMQADVGEYSDCVQLLEQINYLRLPALRGIMHAAGVLSDNFIANQNEEAIQVVLRPKVYGSWYLHSLTINYSMEFFVMFSSLSGILGMIGQCNHAGANRFLDALAHYRVSMGLPCTTINWGAWSEVGAAANIGSAAEFISGFRMFVPSQGIAALKNIMLSREVQVAVSEVTDWNVVKNIFGQGHYVDEMKSDTVEDNKFERYDYLIEEIKQAATIEERQAKIQIYIEAILKQTLNLPESEVLDIDQNFSELGVDSLMAMEMKNRFQTIIGNRTLSISSLQENRTIRSLSAHLAQVMENEPLDTRPLAEIIESDVVLLPEITAAEISAVKPSEFKQILLTGATGHLGVHCLVELLKSTNNLTVHCLVRGKSDEDARKRLDKVLDKYRIRFAEDQAERFKVYAGDMTRDKLGLNDEIYKQLASEVDSIMHCAAKANHLDSYSDGTRHDIRTHNVVGLLHILKFASAQRTKSVLHASTLFAANKLTESGLVVEDFPEESDLGSDMKWGYLLSKFVGEKLLREARNRGIPVKVIRYPFIFGNSETGHMPVEHDHIWSTVVASIRVRMIPKGHLNGVPLIAVDSAAKISAHIFLNDDIEEGMYNLTVDSNLHENMLMDGLTDLGIPCEFVTFKEWTDAVFEEQDTKLMGPLAALYKDEHGQTPMYSLHGLSREMENIDASAFTEKMRRNFPNIENVVPSTAIILRRQVEAHLAGANRSESS